MNADRMIAVFLSGVLVGGAVVYLSPNNGLSVGPSGQHQGSQTGAGGQGQGGPSGGQSSQAAQAATPSGDIGGGGAAGGGASGAGSAGSGGGGDASSSSSTMGTGTPDGQMAGQGPGAPGSMEGSAGGESGSGQGSGGGMMGSDASSQGGGGVQGGGEMEPSPLSASPVSGAPRGATRLYRHLQLAPTLWKAQAEAALSSKDSKIRAMAPAIADHAASVPTVSDRLPPNTEIVSYLVDSKLLLEKMKTAGMDVSSLETQVDEVSKARH